MAENSTLDSTSMDLFVSTLEVPDSAPPPQLSPPIGISETLKNAARLKVPKLNTPNLSAPLGVIDLALDGDEDPKDPFRVLKSTLNRKKEPIKPQGTNWAATKKELMKRLEADRAKGLEERRKRWREEEEEGEAPQEEPWEEEEDQDEEEEGSSDEGDDDAENAGGDVGNAEEEAEADGEVENVAVEEEAEVESESGGGEEAKRSVEEPTDFRALAQDSDSNKENIPVGETARNGEGYEAEERQDDKIVTEGRSSPTQPWPRGESSFTLNLELPDTLSQFAIQGPNRKKDAMEDSFKLAFGDISMESNGDATTEDPGHDEELLMLCSGRFDDSPAKASNTSQNQHSPQLDEPTAEKGEEEEEEGDEIGAGTHRRKLRLIEDSDDDDRPESPNEQEERNSESNERFVEEEEEDVEQEEDSDDDEEIRVHRQPKLCEEKGASLTSMKGKLRKEFLEEEAELSGSDVGSDDEDGGSENDVMEMEEGDLDEVGSDGELREQVGKFYMKQQLDEDKKKLLLYQEAYLEEGDLHSDNRNRRFRWRTQASTAKEPEGEEEDVEDEEAEAIAAEDERRNEEEVSARVERLKWKAEQAEKRKRIGGESSESEDDEEPQGGSMESYFRVGRIQCTSSRSSRSSVVPETPPLDVPDRPFFGRPSLSVPADSDSSKTVPPLFRRDSLLHRDPSTLSSVARSAAQGSKLLNLQANTAKSLYTSDRAQGKAPENKNKDQQARKKAKVDSSVLRFLD